MEYKVIKSRKRRTVAITISHHGEVIVRAPFYLPQYKINHVVEEKLPWIKNKMEELSEMGFFLQKRKEYNHGEEFLLLGNEYALEVHPAQKNSIDIENKKIILQTNNKYSVEKLLTKWLKNEVQKVFIQRFDVCFAVFSQKYTHRKPELKFRKMKSRWGSCSSKGIVTLNTLLIHTPIECLDYVIFHELCHLKHYNHSKEFYQMQETLNPNWKDNKITLKYFLGKVMSL